MSGGNTLQLKGLGYEDMAGTYKCTVVGIGGQNSATGTLQVYCKYCEEHLFLKIFSFCNRQDNFVKDY